MFLNINNSSWVQLLWLWLKTKDQQLFIYINRVWTNSFFDSAIPIWRESIFWVPLYLFLLVFLVMNFKSKAGIYIVFLVLTVTICDQVSSTLLKDWIGRLRPCRDPDFSVYVRLLLQRCPSSGSFTSSHAVNHFGVAMFLYLTMKDVIGKYGNLFFVWAATVSYGQVYVGVHYPLDVIGGAVLGIMIGYLTAAIFNKKVGKLQLAETKTEVRNFI